MKRFNNLEEAMCRELEMLDNKYENESMEMSTQDVEKADVLFHALKSAATYYAMKDSEEWEDDEMSSRTGRNGRSYRRGRDSMGRYTSRDMGGYSGMYQPIMYPRYPGYDEGNYRY